MTVWKPVPGFLGLYEISDNGDIVRIATHGANPKPIRRPLSAHRKPNGYLAADLQKSQVRHRDYVHRLVWKAFRGEIPSGLEINHRNGDKSCNRLENLELLTRSDNMLHGFQNLPFSRHRQTGEEHHGAKLSERDVTEIMRLRRSGVDRSQVAVKFGVSQTAIYYIEIGKNWKHVTGLG